MDFIIITGLSGSGKSTAARVLEDEGYYVVDNFPTSLLNQFLDIVPSDNYCGVAIVMDTRNPSLLVDDRKVFDQVTAAGHKLGIYFFDASDEELIRRYSTTRRRHPLISYNNIAMAIAHERILLQPLRAEATVVFDTTDQSVHQLKATVLQQLHVQDHNAVPLIIRLQSFGFRNGIPLESDLVIDVRFLPNPHYVEDLRPLSGLDDSVSDYVLTQSACKEFLNRTTQWLDFLLPHYCREGKSYLTISIGCTGGHHRSVAIVEALNKTINTQNIKVFHRDLVKEFV